MQKAPQFGRRGLAATVAAPAYVPTPRIPAPSPAEAPAARPEAPRNARPNSTLGFIGRLFFSFQGRIDRRTYRLVRVFWYVCAVLAFYGLGGLAKQAGAAQEPSQTLVWLAPVALLLIVVALSLAVWTTLALRVKRWHDRDKSGFWVLIGLIPIAGALWSLVELCWLEGSPGPNRFGPSPKGDPAAVFD